MIRIGLDEAGYGPRLGPLVLAATIWDGPAEEGRPELDEALAPDVGRTRGAALPIDDSKVLYRKRGDLARLETTVLGALAAARGGDGSAPATLGAFAEAVGAEILFGGGPLAPWYEGLGATPLPRAATPEAIAEARDTLRAAADRAGTALVGLRATMLAAPGFNALCAELGNKARAHWRAFGEVLTGSLAEPGVGAAPVVRGVSDRHGGRAYYGDPLASLFPMAPQRALHETPRKSAYELRPAPEQSLTLQFEVDADARFLEVALASCLAKYLRELHTEAINGWFEERQPGIRPTAGYGADANRFIATVEPILAAEGVERGLLVRSR